MGRQRLRVPSNISCPSLYVAVLELVCCLEILHEHGEPLNQSISLELIKIKMRMQGEHW